MQTAGLHIDNPLSLVKLVTSPLTGRTSFTVCWSCDLWQKIVFDNPPVGWADTLPCMSCPVGTRRASLQFVWFAILKRKYNQTICTVNLSVSYADSSLYQREPCYSLGLKCWFATEQVQQRACFIEIIDLLIFNQHSRCSLNAHTTLPCTGRAGLQFVWADIL